MPLDEIRACPRAIGMEELASALRNNDARYERRLVRRDVVDIPKRAWDQGCEADDAFSIRGVSLDSAALDYVRARRPRRDGRRPSEWRWRRGIREDGRLFLQRIHRVEGRKVVDTRGVEGDCVCFCYPKDVLFDA